MAAHPAPAAYPELLCLAHQWMRASGPLLETAAQRAEELAATDLVAAGLVPYLREHAEEEREHPEWLLADYTSLGRDPADLLGRVPSPTVAALVGSIYYWVLHHHPVAILGYLAALEGNPPSAELLADLQRHSGLPEAAFRTLSHHGAVDLTHRAELYDLLDALPLGAGQAEFVATVAMHSFDLVVAAQLELLEDLNALLVPA